MTRGTLLRWAGWFGCANAALYALIGARYFIGYDWPGDILGLTYTPLAFVGHFATLGILPLVLTAPVLLVWPRRLPVMGLIVLLSAAIATLLFVDSNVFTEYRYHLTPLTVSIFAPTTWLFAGFIAVMALVFESLLAGAVWRWTEGRSRRGGVILGGVLVAVWLAGQGIHIWADAVGYRSVTQLTRYLPGYFPIHAKRRLARWGLVDPKVVAEQQLLQKAGAGSGGQLRYPLAPLSCPAPAGGARPLNLLVVLLDAIRPDIAVPALMPNVAAIAAGGQEFTNHYSGGNSSRAGLFSFFFGLPSTYMETFYGVQRPPVLLDELRARGYEFVLHAAPGFGTPTDINRTVFAGVPGLPGENHALNARERNVAVTDAWLDWVERYDGSRPFFGFLYYDPPMGEMSAEPDSALPLEGRFAPDEKLQKEWRQYRRSARFVDDELGRIRASLAARSLGANTVLIVVSDHGFEFDDYGNGYTGHASDYSAAQLRATLAMEWPGRPPARWSHRTSHHDVPPTLLTGLFGCTNPPEDYSVGRDLFAGIDWRWIVAGSYNSHAIVEPDRVIVTSPGGFVEVRGPDYRPLDARPDADVITAAMAEMRRFYR